MPTIFSISFQNDTKTVKIVNSFTKAKIRSLKAFQFTLSSTAFNFVTETKETIIFTFKKLGSEDFDQIKKTTYKKGFKH